jgi:hypothetical protein
MLFDYNCQRCGLLPLAAHHCQAVQTAFRLRTLTADTAVGAATAAIAAAAIAAAATATAASAGSCACFRELPQRLQKRAE